MAGVRTIVTEPICGYELTVVDLDPLRAAICAVGELDLAARQDLADVLQEQQDARRRIVRLDLSQVTFLDCSCLGVLVSAHYRFLRLHGLLVLTGVHGRVARVLDLTGLDEILFIVPGDRDPFGSGLTAPASGRREAQGQPDAVLSSVSSLVAAPARRDPADIPGATPRKAAS